MDVKTHILRWQREIGENPAVLILAIFIAVAIVFVLAVFIDAFLKNRKKNKRRRHH